jgi:uncharacterized membrane protein YciS (DUF1049 family)
MVSTNSWIIILVLLIAISIAGISGSSYSLGIQQNDKTSTAYQVAASFLGISIVFCIAFMIGLVATVLYSNGIIQTQSVQGPFRYVPPNAPLYRQ